ncbi:MAG TPA: hypothetical protein VKB86_18445, partial [Pyrinomonadaceae bacterium]|nr:hypothetical protein [Pyrinomonadaceae bacterium]
MIRGNNARYYDAPDENRRNISAYPELSGESPALSTYARLQQEQEQERQRARTILVEKLINTDVERKRDMNFEELEKHRNYYRRIAGREITSSDEARGVVMPCLERVRDLLLRMADERAQIKIETTRTQ